MVLRHGDSVRSICINFQVTVNNESVKSLATFLFLLISFNLLSVFQSRAALACAEHDSSTECTKSMSEGGTDLEIESTGANHTSNTPKDCNECNPLQCSICLSGHCCAIAPPNSASWRPLSSPPILTWDHLFQFFLSYHYDLLDRPPRA